MPNYTASKSSTPGRPGWSISFRHPLRNDSRGKPGLKMRRGLNTTDSSRADELVAQMNELLGDPSWWNAARRREAEAKFDKAIVDAFFGEIQAGQESPGAIRDRLIPLPGRSEGFARVLFVGTTGAGKTTLLRKLIGSDPDRDRFPSTAPAKTTIADIEIVAKAGEFEGAVTFFSEFHVTANLEECVTDACLQARAGADDAKVAERLLNHRDQKFRLSYVLGSWSDEQEEEDEDISFDLGEAGEAGQDQLGVDAEGGGLSSDERVANMVALRGYVQRIRSLAERVSKKLELELGLAEGAGSEDDRKAAEELLEEAFDTELASHEEFHDLVQDLLEAVRSRFDRISAGTLELSPSKWPAAWRFQSADREEFLKQVRFFSSNYWPLFGSLLTPIVEGMRIRGPLFPEFRDDQPKLVLIDGQGLGHTPESSASVSTHITKRFDSVDMVLLVDNAKQPMQAAPLAVLRAVTAGGHHTKLAIAFTHFDQINAPSLRTVADKRAHVMGSVTNALAHLEDVLGAPVVRDLQRLIEKRCFMLGGVDRADTKLPAKALQYVSGELSEMTDLFLEAIKPPPPAQATPVYDPMAIAFVVQEAVTKFIEPWLGRLGLAAHAGVHKEHWTRVRALNRRIAGELGDEYDTLRPVADLVGRFSEAFSRFLDNPTYWKGGNGSEEEKQAVISGIRRAVSTVFHSLAAERLLREQLESWRTAYDAPEYRGKGSTFKRALKIEEIYEAAAPIPDAAMTQFSAVFLAKVRELVTAAIRENGGEVELTKAHSA